MIVLDEQLLGWNLEQEIAAWYRGTVRYIIDLRPQSVIKDDAIPALLRQENQPTFVTINEKDFWHKVAIDRQFCIVCLPLPDSRAAEIPSLLRALLRHPQFRTKDRRMGMVIRVSRGEARYYSFDDRQERTSLL